MKQIFITLILLTTINLQADIFEESQNGCLNGDPGACYHLGDIYTQEKNVQKAREFYTKACDGGHAKGCYQIGLIYENGEIVKHNYAMAAKFYTKSCNGSNEKACLKLGYMYKNALGVKADSSKAKDFFEKACDGSSDEACNEHKKMKAKK